ncbi:hypothetical protein J7438_05365 [Thalassotalea sp. G20_0]|uniref:hypothetical protein n=1 Tax=Thalassotalea sp. G20_0 TaxID=2821093 RepID=UPI001ADA3DB6|nr:hypothetical protein [Thalassotalea sp. G20_0]MBO9493516.1 hypothetical protein [Thalassotalea sp. G20_0]
MFFYPAHSTPVDSGKVEPPPLNTEGKDKAPAHRSSEEKTSILFRTTSGACFRCRPADADLLPQLYCFPCSNLTSKSLKTRDSTKIYDPSHVIESAPFPPESAQGDQHCGVIDLARQSPSTAPDQDDSDVLPLPADIRCARKFCPDINQFAQCQVLTELSKSLEVACARGVMLNNLQGAEDSPPGIECGQWLSLHELPAHYHNDGEHPARTLASVFNKPGVNPLILPEPTTATSETEGASAGVLATPTIAYAQYEAMVKQFGEVLNGFAGLRRACQNQADSIDELCRAIVSQQSQIQKLELELQIHKATTGNGVLLWKIPGFKNELDKIRSGDSQQLISPLFHSIKGHALYARIYLTGDSADQDRDIGLSIGLMPSLYDPIQTQQFSGSILFEILGRRGGVIHSDVIFIAENVIKHPNPEDNPKTFVNCISISQKKMMDECLVDDDLFIRCRL